MDTPTQAQSHHRRYIQTTPHRAQTWKGSKTTYCKTTKQPPVPTHTTHHNPRNPTKATKSTTATPSTAPRQPPRKAASTRTVENRKHSQRPTISHPETTRRNTTTHSKSGEKTANVQKTTTTSEHHHDRKTHHHTNPGRPARESQNMHELENYHRPDANRYPPDCQKPETLRASTRHSLHGASPFYTNQLPSSHQHHRQNTQWRIPSAKYRHSDTTSNHQLGVH